MFDATILIVEDEPHIRRAMRRAALGTARRVIEADTATGAIEEAAAQSPDVVVLDLALPDRHGIEVCRELRRWSPAPIIVVTANDSQREKVRLLDMGADDYMTKPFDPEEFAARLRVQLRRGAARAALVALPVERYGHLSIDVPGRTVRRHDREPDERIKLTKTEWAILMELVANAGRTLTHATLRDRIWSGPASGTPHDIRMHIVNLRRKIERDPAAPSVIITEPGVGYRFEQPDGA